MMDESVYNLIPKAPVPIIKPLRYESKHREKVKDEVKHNKQSHKTMGELSTSNAIKKHHQMDKEVTTEVKLMKNVTIRKPPIPKQCPTSKIILRKNKNYVVYNIKRNDESKPIKLSEVIVDSRNGNRLKLENSGLVPKYSKKKDYGAVPKYLVLKNEKRSIKDEVEEEELKDENCQKIGDEEKNEILKNLQLEWEMLHHAYQGLSLVTDTARKKHRKEDLELQMKQLESNIDMLKKHKNIYVSPD